ncbi:IS66 family transposase, partial [Bacteroides thetaiotaomicron]
RMHGINTFEYIADVINKAAKLPPNTDRKIYRDLLPHKWKENRNRI